MCKKINAGSLLMIADWMFRMRSLKFIPLVWQKLMFLFSLQMLRARHHTKGKPIYQWSRLQATGRVQINLTPLTASLRWSTLKLFLTLPSPRLHRSHPAPTEFCWRSSRVVHKMEDNKLLWGFSTLFWRLLDAAWISRGNEDITEIHQMNFTTDSVNVCSY